MVMSIITCCSSVDYLGMGGGGGSNMHLFYLFFSDFFSHTHNLDVCHVITDDKFG